MIQKCFINTPLKVDQQTYLKDMMFVKRKRRMAMFMRNRMICRQHLLFRCG